MTEQRAFLVHLLAAPAEAGCIRWPYTLCGGYPRMKESGQPILVTRLILTETVGPPPEGSRYEAAHSCGVSWCVNPQHLRWATRAENQRDRIIHGTHSRGEKSGKAKLKEWQVREILALKGKLGQHPIARRYGISRSAVKGIHGRTRWAHVGAQPCM